MRLIAAYIAGFGRLTDQRIDYEKGITALCMENGWGKTTLAYFHKAMFYGLDSTGKLKGDLKERERYKPWTAAPFGGWLEFAVDRPDGEKSYRIERTFGDKSAKDHFALLSLPDLRPSADFTDPVGMALFGLNAGSFIRTVFSTGALRTPPQSPDSGLLAERFGENPADGKTLARAIDKLEDRRVELQTRRGDNGRIPDLRREIFALDRQIADCRHAADQAEQHRTNLLEIGRQIAQDQAKSAEIREEIDRCSQKQTDAAHLEHYRGLLARMERLRKEKSDEEKFFKDAEYTGESLTLLQKKADECRLAAEYAKQVNIPFDGEREYDELFDRFRGRLPDADAMNYHREIEEKLSLGYRRAREIMESEEYLRLSERFSDHVPDEETVDRMIALEEASRKKVELPAKIALVPGCVFLISILGCLLSAGILRGIFIGLIVLSGVALIVSALILSRRGRPKDDTLTEFMLNYDLLEYDGDLLSGLHRLRSDLALYRAECEKLAALSLENQALSTELSEFLDYYHAPDRRTLEAWVRRSIELDNARKAHSERAESARVRAEKASADLAGLLDGYPVDPADPEGAVSEIRGHGNTLVLLTRALADAEREAEQFAAQHPAVLAAETGDPAADPSVPQTLDSLRRQEAELSARLDAGKDAYRREESARQACTKEADRISILSEERQRKAEQSEQAAAALAAIERAEALLTQASQNLSDRYLTGVQERFAHYLGKLVSDETESVRYRMDGSLAVLSEEAGKQRVSGLLSTGKQDLVALCARFALADALMDGKADFLILDDPFTNLDDDRVESALALLGELAEDRQILYLTCSRSRMPGQTKE